MRNVLLDIFTHRKNMCTIGIGDVFLQQGSSINETQFIATSRYLDIKRFFEYNGCDFLYKNTFCKTFFGNKHNVTKSNQNFIDLINSFVLNGFDDSYPIAITSTGYLFDGNHRCGACLYFKIEKLTAHILKDSRRINQDIDKFIFANISTNILSNVLLEFKNIQTWLIDSGNTFALIASNFVTDNDIDDFVLRLDLLCTILAIHKKNNTILVQFSLSAPKYRLHGNHLISVRCIEIETKMKKIYPEINLKIAKSCYEGNILIKNKTQYI